MQVLDIACELVQAQSGLLLFYGLCLTTEGHAGRRCCTWCVIISDLTQPNMTEKELARVAFMLRLSIERCLKADGGLIHSFCGCRARGVRVHQTLAAGTHLWIKGERAQCTRPKI